MATKINREALRQRIKTLAGLSDDERAALLELVNSKKYGLVWENHPEKVEERLRTHLPVLDEVPERYIPGSSPSSPNHILIEGDNLEALTALTYTHEGRIDVIYIDPPYNTGNKDFSYNDHYVDADDDYRHSKWLSFMSKRLRIARSLLNQNGVIFISIDDNEYSQLKLLCDEVFDYKLINSIVVKSSETSGVKMSHTDKKLPKIKEYLLVYSSGKLHDFQPLTISKTDDIDKFKSYAKYYSKIIINKEANVENWIIKPINEYLTEKEIYYSEDELLQFKLDNADKIVYRTNNKALSKMQFETNTAKVTSATGIEYIWWEGKQMLFLDDYISECLCDLWIDISTINLNKEICDLPSFSNGQKPIELIKRIEQLSTNKNITILDFFAGSGTTLHATMQLNKEDGGHRQCILVTNNENNICEEVTYERNRRVIQGYTTPKGVEVEGLTDNSLRYYRTRLLPRQRTNRNMRDLMAAATDLLCIKEDIFEELRIQNLEIRNIRKHVRLFGKGDRLMMVIYSEEAIPRIVEWLKTTPPLPSSEGWPKAGVCSKEGWPKAGVCSNPIKIYTFSYTNYAYDDDFAEVEERVQLCALPAAIYEAYRRVLPQEDRYYDNEIIDGSDINERKEDNQ